MDYALPRASDFPLFELCATGIATVDDAGAVTGVSSGEAQISATFENRTGAATVTVQARPPVQQWRGLTIAAENRCCAMRGQLRSGSSSWRASSGCLRERAKSYVQDAETVGFSDDLQRSNARCSMIDWTTGHGPHRDHCLGSVERRVESDFPGVDLVVQASQFEFKLREVLRRHRMQPFETGGPLDAAHRGTHRIRKVGLRQYPRPRRRTAPPVPIRALAIRIGSM